MPAPLPPRQKALMSACASLSLRFDHGYDGYDGHWHHRKADRTHPDDGKTEFLRAFVSTFKAGNPEYASFIRRRAAALPEAKCIPITSSSPLIVGLGRANAMESGFTLDRLTGAPHIPGSSVKGLLHAAARLTAAGDLAGDAAFWGEQETRIFGTTETPGQYAFFDAYPSRWPELELDVLTPHYQDYYRPHGAEAAADWEDPVPVHFLRVQRGVEISFWIGARSGVQAAEGDLAALERLLGTALDWIGIGGKRSSGYGWFEEGSPSADAPKRDAPTSRALESTTIVWEKARIEWKKNTQTLEATHEGSRALGKQALYDALSEGLRRKLLRGDAVTATVTLEKIGHKLTIMAIGEN